MNKHFLLKKKSMLAINLLSGLFFTACFSMEDNTLEPIEENFSESEQLPILGLTKRVLDLQKTHRLGSIGSFSNEFDKFAKNREISTERAVHLKQSPDLDISQIRKEMATIDLKLEELERLESLAFANFGPTKDKSSNKKKKQRSDTKKISFKSIKRRVKKADLIIDLEKKILLIRQILARENTENLSEKERKELCTTLQNISDCIPLYINSLNQKIKNLKSQIQQQDSNKLKLSLGCVEFLKK